jgi:large subunit ribosomal protein L5
MLTLKEKYKKEVIPAMMERFNYKNPLQVPRIEKIVLNMGIGEASKNAGLMDKHVKELANIAGQKPVVTRAKKSIAGFKIREGMPLGAKVTLRKDLMYNFLFKLITFALPKVKDFRGLNPNAFDGRGNYSFGVTEQLIFSEISYDEVQRQQGMNINITTTAKTDEEARELLKLMGMPFKRQ